MSGVNLADFRRVAKASLDSDVRQYAEKRELEINTRLLGRFLIENADRFSRSVVQTVSVNGDYHNYDVMSEIGFVSGEQFFFEIINPELDAVNIHVVDQSAKTSSPAVIYREFTNELCHEIVDYLVVSKIGEQSTRRRDILTVPPGVYVFEFKLSTGDKRTVTVPPVQAKDLAGAIAEYRNWPGLEGCPYPRSFRVCTESGWQKLHSKLRKYTSRDAGPRDYILTLP